jgi:CDP-diacylglycerol--glycerol-3-phosphate 3-phosphatidyltransferase
LPDSALRLSFPHSAFPIPHFLMLLNWPNRISLARILLVPPYVICLLNLNETNADWRHIALIMFVVMALSDALDGYLARRWKESTALGRFLDPLGDKLLVTASMVLLSIDATAVHGFQLPNWVPVIAIGKDVLTVLGFLVVYMVTGKYFIQPRVLGKACTLIQSVMIGFSLAAPDFPSWAQALWPILYTVASAAAVAAFVDYVRIGNRFASQS